MKTTNTDVYGFEHAIRGMRNPKESWGKSDSITYEFQPGLFKFSIGNADAELSKKLAKAGTEHCKHLRLIQVWFDLEAPRYFWQEFDTYRNVEKISCSTMNKLFERELTIEDFELKDIEDSKLLDVLQITIDEINDLRYIYKKSPDDDYLRRAKILLLESFIQKRTINTNYQQLLNIYRQRKNHRLLQWQEFCEWIEELPYFKELTGIEYKK
ncbi:hypothetical protein CLPU_6c00210 [Gottschalkia purinilytica]|uniref:Uncharacterized protein n=1 Tax=Gottschalkia purinilytica TaxID=1503 RepID=A0A0L0WB35_GOTPU|nr:hypothetical protein [Gottschalkia purinilytica]KNF08535.1 hypothetical protein CLPU_6c00210 [Gottschalkia purinilytica]